MMRKKSFALFLLALLPTSVAYSQVAAVQTCPSPGTHFRDCSLENFHTVIKCAVAITNWSKSASIKIDDCVGNSDGQMVHGSGAGDSCKDYTVYSDNTLHASCRDNDGQLRSTSINLNDYLVVYSATETAVNTSIDPNRNPCSFLFRCAQ
ncbi:MAG: CVNH domain-containing protein [Chromatiaceae bacterium]|nr:CVNH domain-containing protein [Chromatiaceae bacterium]MCF7995244.1 CVNH domain-containing protein [Chromatiaceae bacterium]MCF8004148.1 CVNH domain-containing protein [Chromatiaceae bacterium]